MIGGFRGLLGADMNWSMVRGDRWVVCIPNYGVYGSGGNGVGEEKLRLRSSSQATDQKVGL